MTKPVVSSNLILYYTRKLANKMGGTSAILMKFTAPTDKTKCKLLEQLQNPIEKSKKQSLESKPLTHIQDILLSWLGPDT